MFIVFHSSSSFSLRHKLRPTQDQDQDQDQEQELRTHLRLPPLLSAPGHPAKTDKTLFIFVEYLFLVFIALALGLPLREVSEVLALQNGSIGYSSNRVDVPTSPIILGRWNGRPILIDLTDNEINFEEPKKG